MDDVELLRQILRSKGLTEKQIEAGVKYYINFASKFEIPVYDASKMVVNMIENMRRRLSG